MPHPIQWEIDREYISPLEVKSEIAMLKRRGRQGWQLVGPPVGGLFYFQRPETQGEHK